MAAKSMIQAAILLPAKMGHCQLKGTWSSLVRAFPSPDPFLMAVATGAGCDFLTPVGHQRNTLVIGPCGFRFGVYARSRLPLSLLVIIAGAPVIALIWPHVPH
jgi:di/tricarboxylate transporter